MDKQTKEYVKRNEERLVAMGEELGEAKIIADGLQKQLGEKEKQLSKYKQRLDAIKDMTTQGQSAHQQDIGELAEYQRTNAKLIKALQEIADGKGKYAKIAKDALGA